MTEFGELKVSFSSRGIPKYEIKLTHTGLKKVQVLRDGDRELLLQKARLRGSEWDQQWRRREEAEAKKAERERQKQEKEERKALAETRTVEAREVLDGLRRILASTLDVDDAVDWESLKTFASFDEPAPAEPSPLPPPQYPEILNRKPLRDGFSPRFNVLDLLIPALKRRKSLSAEQAYLAAHSEWERAAKEAYAEFESMKRQYPADVERQSAAHRQLVDDWESRRQAFTVNQDTLNGQIDSRRAAYAAKDPEAVRDYCELVLNHSRYPDYFPQTFDVAYVGENGLLICDYDLPEPAALPKLNDVTYVASRDEFKEKDLPDKEFNKLYDDVVYQIALRTIHELLEADVVNAIETLVFNGHVHSLDEATGNDRRTCIISIQVAKQEFLQINLARVNPKACFRKLKGVGSSELHSVTPVPPLVSFNRDDDRIVESYDVAHSLNEGVNLAVLNWEDFEHLVREIFEKEFGQHGAEVKVTRASRDGGVDAIVFDPDPIRGGKFVIQAKRYTNTVGVSAVRDLYGTLQHEGANKGILVTTSVYGPDAYEFARGKPLQLLDGGNLLHLLERHGHKARIDLVEAKQLAAQSETVG